MSKSRRIMATAFCIVFTTMFFFMSSAWAKDEEANQGAPDETVESICSGIPFVAPNELLSDPPEGELSLFGAQAVLDAYLWNNMGDVLWEDAGLSYVYNGIVDHNGAEYYEYQLREEAEPGVYDEIATCIVGGYGDIYEMDETGEYTLLLPWAGNYMNDTADLYILQYDGVRFGFLFNSSKGDMFQGLAKVDPEDQTRAEYMDMIFTLEDKDTVSVEQVDGWEKGADERAMFTGGYEKIYFDKDSNIVDPGE